MADIEINISSIERKMHSNISAYIEDYSKSYFLTVSGDVLFRLYLYFYEELNKDAPSCAPSQFPGTSSNSDAWSDILLSTSLAEVFGVEQKKYQLNVSEAMASPYACLVLLGKYVFNKPKSYQNRDPFFWHIIDRIIHRYESDKKSVNQDFEKGMAAYYLKLHFQKTQTYIWGRRVIFNGEQLSDERKDEIVRIVQNISSNFDSVTDLNKLSSMEKKEKTSKDTMGKGKNYIRFPEYLAPLIRASYVSVHDFPYLPNHYVYTGYKKYDDIYDIDWGIDEKTYVCLKRIIRYKDYIRDIKKNIKVSDDSFLKKYFSAMYAIFDSVDKEDATGATKHYGRNMDFMDNRAYYYLTEKIYGYYLFRYEAKLIKQKKENLDFLDHEEKRLLKRALNDIFVHCPGIFTRLQAAAKAIEFIFEASEELMVSDTSSQDEIGCETEHRWGNHLNKAIAKRNNSRLNQIIKEFDGKHFIEDEGRAIKMLLNEVYVKKGDLSIEKLIFNKMEERIQKIEDKTGLITYYDNGYVGYHTSPEKLREGQAYEGDSVDGKYRKDDKSYQKILSWVIKKSVGNKWYDFFEQTEE